MSQADMDTEMGSIFEAMKESGVAKDIAYVTVHKRHDTK
jgi:hypothetical protein